MIRGIDTCHCQGDLGGQSLHCHEEVEFIAVYRGRGRLQAGASQHATGPGVFSVVCPGEPHAGTPASADFAVKVLHVSAGWFAAAGLDWRGLWHRSALCETRAGLDTFLATYAVVQTGQSRLHQEAVVINLHGVLCGSSPAPRRPETKRVRQVADRLRQDFSEDLSLAELAADVDLAPAYLCRAFTKQLGLPPHAYQIALRVARAKTLLTAGVTPAQTARTVGFYDQSHLTLHCKRLLGLTPGQIRRGQFPPIRAHGAR